MMFMRKKKVYVDENQNRAKLAFESNPKNIQYIDKCYHTKEMMYHIVENLYDTHFKFLREDLQQNYLDSLEKKIILF